MTPTPPSPLTRRTFLARAAWAGGGLLLPRLGAAVPPATPGPTLPPAPVARLAPVTETLWGESITDPYRWMENPADPAWLPYLHGQDDHARAVLAGLPRRTQLLERIGQLSGDTVQAVGPHPAGGLVFFERRLPGEAQYKLVVRPATATHTDDDRVLVDLARFSRPDAPASLDWWQPAPDGRHVVFGVSLAGSERSVGRVVRSIDARVLDDQLTDVPYAAPAWVADGSGFFYNRFAGRPATSPDYYSDRSAWFHRLGTAQADDRCVAARGTSPTVTMSAISSPEVQTGVGGRHAVMAVREGYAKSFALYAAPLAGLLAEPPAPRWRRLCGPDDGVADFALVGDDVFLLDTAGAPRGRVLRLDARTGVLSGAVEAVPPTAQVVAELNAGRDGVWLTYSDGGEQSLAFLALAANSRPLPVALPYAGWIQSVAVDPLSGTALTRVTGWLNPATVFALTPGAAPTSDSPASAPVAVAQTALQPAPPIDLTPYDVQRLFATAADGTRVPVTVIAHRDDRLAPEGRRPRPCLMHVYGAYQWPSQPVFDTRGVAFLEAGGIIATAHVRGGGEYGAAWHAGGLKSTKPNTWRDLIACGEELVRQGYTAARRIAPLGGSAGGIAVGMAMVERPDLFGAVVSKVGMANPLRAEFEPNGQPNVPEFGSIKDEAGFRALKAMDTTQAVRPGVAYPPGLLTTSVNDARVAPHNAGKLAARLQALNPRGITLLKVDFAGGHEANTLEKHKADADAADEFAFVLAFTQG